MNLYGMNFNGADICGFLEETTPELCQKWTNVGAFYPFARNHDDIHNEGQEFYRFEDDVQATMINAVRWRYAFLRYFYTQLYINNIHGGMFWKPLFFEFPDESAAYENIEKNVMIGSAIKFSPLLDEGNIKTQGFTFPAGTWCNLIDYKCFTNKKTATQNLNVQPSNLNLHLRMGYIIPFQRNSIEQGVVTTEGLKDIPMGIVINVDTNTKKAEGEFFADDGVTLNNPNNLFILFEFDFSEKDKAILTLIPIHAQYKNTYTNLETIEILAAKGAGLNKFTKINIDGRKEVTGNYVSGKDLLTFNLGDKEDMQNIKEIVFTK